MKFLSFPSSQLFSSASSLEKSPFLSLISQDNHWFFACCSLLFFCQRFGEWLIYPMLLEVGM